MVLLESSMVPLGTPASDFSLKGTDSKLYSLSDFSDKKVLVIIFMCNHCPYVQAMWDDLVNLSREMTDVQFVGINSNANPDYPEDSFEKMAEYAQQKGMEFPYLYDESQEASKAYDAQCTPDIFVYGEDRKLAYRGAFDGVKDAATALMNGEKPSESQKHSMGCSIKWNA